ncbi:MAG: aspartate kinase [Elusimicrobia bacterium]|jgi:aspartate kinase|nr:aspartate kinase [Elusimicrobiota bacterium]MBK7545076.1 aspartate kinase [Elusimicrobiota bacterium]MBK7574595.1 aspartate kinase [Elusimicrobiota bacterium]MBK8126742.1 aspartate kinase [Elusimicrobiota bacterium]MBK8423559.1 aspartate kinase [Elusimicrobiota bacterium]
MSQIVVMKFGGSSVADADRIKNVAHRVIAKRRAGHRVVVVVSAPGDMTDDLIEMAEKITERPSGREMDMLLSTGEQVSIALLSMAINHQGVQAVSLTGPQAGIFADADHTRARIVDIRPKKIFDQLKKGRVVIVAGFQGLNPNEDIATLGRGGSDLTAVALAAALKADVCEIYTDVKGVYTTDPRIAPEAQKIDRISFEEMLELAGAGAQVMQPRSIEVGKKYNVDIHVRSSFTDDAGTLITAEVPRMEDVVVSGVAYDPKQAKITLRNIADRPGVAAKIFGPLADEGINVDMIIQSAPQSGRNDISFTVARGETKKAMSVLDDVSRDLKADEVVLDDKVAKVSIVGIGMRGHPGVAAKLFKTLADAGVNIDMISTSEIKVACIVKEADGPNAVRLAHKAFGLEKPRPAAKR